MMHRTSAGSAAGVAPVSLFALLVAAAIGLVFVVVLFSAYLRLSASGLSCGDWPLCYGRVAALAQAPLGLGIVGWATLIHRLVATALGLVVLGIVIVALARRRAPGQPVWVPLAVLALTLFLALLGQKTPSPLLPWVTLGNLLGGMLLLAALWWLGLRPLPASEARAARLRPWVWVALLAVTVQIALGAWTSANYAALACPALAGCAQVEWGLAEAASAFDLTRQLAPTASGQVAAGNPERLIHLAHRAGAVVVLIYVGGLALYGQRLGGRYARIGRTTVAVVTAQFALGLASVAYGLPLWLVLAHNGNAALLLLCLVTFAHRLGVGRRMRAAALGPGAAAGDVVPADRRPGDDG